MKLLVVLCALVAIAVTAPTAEFDLAVKRALPALEYEEVHDEYGQYALRYVTAEGTVVSQRAWLEPTGHGTYVLVTEGETSYIGDDGELYVTKYYAGINGTTSETEHHPIAPLATKPESNDQSEN